MTEQTKEKDILPLFKYIGGKTWLKHKLMKALDESLSQNKEIKTYVEPFCGGLGAFLGVHHVLLKHGIRRIFLNDINLSVVHVYKNITENQKQTLSIYREIEDDFVKTIPKIAYQTHPLKEKELFKKYMQKANEFFKMIRADFNDQDKASPKASAMLLFLQNHSYNGIYRENMKGEYNTPFNWSLKTNAYEQTLERTHSILKVFDFFSITFSSMDYSKLDMPESCIIYVDPPYINEKNNANKYHSSSFSIDDQRQLINLLSGHHFIYSNHYNDLIIQIFKELHVNFKICSVYRKNIISSSIESRSQDKKELIIISDYMNYHA